MSSKVGIILINNSSYIINEGISFIGRDPVICSIILTNITISKQHALLINLKNEYFISDLQSTNGTTLEDEVLIPRKLYELHDNVTITLGDISGKFVLQDPQSSFKIPQQLPPRSMQTPIKYKSIRQQSPIIQTDIHNLPTQLDEYEDVTQKLFSATTSTPQPHINLSDTQILDSTVNNSLDLICESINVEVSEKKLSLTNKLIRNTFNTYKDSPRQPGTNHEDDFMIAETQAANNSSTIARNAKIYEVDESLCMENSDFTDADISDSQMSNIKLETQLMKEEECEIDISAANKNLNTHEISNSDSLGETQFDLDNLEYNSTTCSGQNKSSLTVLPRNNSPNLLTTTYCASDNTKIAKNSQQKSIYELETQITAEDVNLNDAIDHVTDLEHTKTNGNSSAIERKESAHQKTVEGSLNNFKDSYDLNQSENTQQKIVQKCIYDLETQITAEDVNLNDAVDHVTDLEHTKTSIENSSTIERKESPHQKTAERSLNNFGNSHDLNSKDNSQQKIVRKSIYELETQLTADDVGLNDPNDDVTRKESAHQKTAEGSLNNFKNQSGQSQQKNIYELETQLTAEDVSLNDANNDVIDLDETQFDDEDANNIKFKNIHDLETQMYISAGNGTQSMNNMEVDSTKIGVETVKIEELCSKDSSNISEETFCTTKDRRDQNCKSNTDIRPTNKNSEDDNRIMKHKEEIIDEILEKDNVPKTSEVNETLTDQNPKKLPQIKCLKNPITSKQTSNEINQLQRTETIEENVLSNFDMKISKINKTDGNVQESFESLPSKNNETNENLDKDKVVIFKSVSDNSSGRKITLPRINNDTQNLNETDIFNMATQKIRLKNDSKSNTEKIMEPDDIFNIPTQVITNKKKCTLNDSYKITKNVKNTTTLTKQSTDDDKLNDPNDIFNIPTQIIVSTAKNTLNEHDSIYDIPTQVIGNVENTSNRTKKSIDPDDDIFDIPTQIITPKMKDTSNNISKENDSQKNTKIVENTTSTNKPSTSDDKLNDPDDIFDVPTQIITPKMKGTSNNKLKASESQKSPKIVENTTTIAKPSTSNDKLNDPDDIFDIPTQIISSNTKGTSSNTSNEKDSEKNTKSVENTTTTTFKESTHDDKLNDPDDIFDIPTQIITPKMKDISNNTLNASESQKSTKIVENTTTIAKPSTSNDKLNDPDDIFDIPTQIITSNTKGTSSNTSNQKDSEKNTQSVENTTTIVKQSTHDDKLNNPDDIFDIPTQIITPKMKDTSNNTLNASESQKSRKIIENTTTTTLKESTHDDKLNDPDDIFDMPTQIITSNQNSKNQNQKSTNIVENTTTTAKPSTSDDKLNDPDDIFDMPTQIITPKMKVTSNNTSNQNSKNQNQKSTNIVENTTTIAKESTHDDKLNDPDDIFDMPTQIITTKIKSTSNKMSIKNDYDKITKNVENTTTIAKPSTSDDKLNDLDDIFDMPTEIITGKTKDTSNNASNEKDCQKNIKIVENIRDDKLNDPDDIFDMPTQIITPKMKDISNNKSKGNNSHKNTKIIENTTTIVKPSTSDDKLSDPDDIFDIPTQIITTKIKNTSKKISKEKDSKKSTKIVENTTTTLKQSTHDDKLNDRDDIFNKPTEKICQQQSNKITDNDEFDKISKIDNINTEITSTDADDDIYDFPTQKICKPKTYSNTTRLSSDTHRYNIPKTDDFDNLVGKIASVIDTVTKIDVTDTNDIENLNETNIFDIPTEIISKNTANASKEMNLPEVRVKVEIEKSNNKINSASNKIKATTVEENTSKPSVRNTSRKTIKSTKKNELEEPTTSKVHDATRDHVTDCDNDSLPKDVKNKKQLENVVDNKRTTRNAQRVPIVEMFLSNERMRKRRKQTRDGANDEHSEILESPSKKIKTDTNATTSTNSSKSSNNENNESINLRNNLRSKKDNVKIELFDTNENTGINVAANTTQRTRIKTMEKPSDVSDQSVILNKGGNNSETITNNRNKRDRNSELSSEKNKRKKISQDDTTVTSSASISTRGKTSKIIQKTSNITTNDDSSSTHKIIDKNQNNKRRCDEGDVEMLQTSYKKDLNEAGTSKNTNQDSAVQQRLTRNKGKSEVNVTESKITNETDTSKNTNQDLAVQQRLSRNKAKSKVNVTESTSNKNQKKKFKVIFTMFRDEEQEKIVKKLGGKIVDKIQDTDVLVTNQIRRSVKLLSAVSHAIPIVSPRWLDVCDHSAQFVDPWDYLLIDVEAEKKFGFKLKDSLNRAKNGLLLDGYTVMVTKSIPADMKDILENSGAKYITVCPKTGFPDKSFIVSTIEDKSQWPSKRVCKNVHIVTAEAIFSSVIRQKLDFKNHLLL